MSLEHSLQAGEETLREAPETLTMTWLLEHTNMQIALRAYEEGLRRYGQSRIDTTSPQGRERLAVVQSKVRVTYQYPAFFSLSAHGIHEALCLLPTDWLRHAHLQRIEVVPSQYFCFSSMEEREPTWKGEHFIGKVIDGAEAEAHFAGNPVPALEEEKLTGPPSRYHYAPGQYLEKKEAAIRLWQEPADVRARIAPEALQEYGRELVVHEALHAVLQENLPLEFQFAEGWLSYWDVLGQFQDICLAERVSTSEYSELYAPWIRLPLDTDRDLPGWKRRFRVKTALQEELGELLSARLRGWGALPQGEAMRPEERAFGGTAFREHGMSRKVAFVDALIRAPVRLKSDAASVS